MREDLFNAAKQCYGEFSYAIFGCGEWKRVGDRLLPEDSLFIRDVVGQPFAIVAEASREEADAWLCRWNMLSGRTSHWPVYVKYFYKVVTE